MLKPLDPIPNQSHPMMEGMEEKMMMMEKKMMMMEKQITQMDKVVKQLMEATCQIQLTQVEQLTQLQQQRTSTEAHIHNPRAEPWSAWRERERESWRRAAG